MPGADGTPLLAPDEPAAFRIEREHGRSAFFIVCDHAGAQVPRRLSGLGLAAHDLQRHIAWDIGAGAVATLLAARLDAFTILQTYSRLVIDCNRPPGSEQSIVQVSEATPIPGNRDVSPAEAQAREREIFRPYHDRIRAELDARAAAGRRTILVSMHSFTPTYHGVPRAWHAGLLYNRDRRLAGAMLPLLRAEPGGLVVGDNEPYAASDATDYAIPVYGEQRALQHVGIEVRQDLIADAAGQARWAERLANVLRGAGGET